MKRRCSFLDVELTLENLALKLEEHLVQRLVLAESELGGDDGIAGFPGEFGGGNGGCGGVVDFHGGELCGGFPLLKGDEGVEGVSTVAAVVEQDGHVSLFVTQVAVEFGEAFGD